MTQVARLSKISRAQQEGAMALLRDAQGLPRKDEVGVEDLVAVGLQNPRPRRRVAVEALGEGRERVTGDHGVLGEALVRVDQGATDRGSCAATPLAAVV